MAKEYAKWFYNSQQWHRCRQSFVLLKFGVCERCGRPGTVAHHRKPITPTNIKNNKITLNHKNLELLCDDCHNKVHKTKNNNTQVSFNEYGKVVPPITDTRILF